MVINVPLVTMTPQNGSTEIWLGTHNGTTIADQEGEHGDRASGRIKTHLLEARKQVRPPYQPVVKKGSIIIRDLRLWHGGKPNLSDEPRVMLAMSKFCPGFFAGVLLVLMNFKSISRRGIAIRCKSNSHMTCEIDLLWRKPDCRLRLRLRSLSRCLRIT